MIILNTYLSREYRNIVKYQNTGECRELHELRTQRLPGEYHWTYLKILRIWVLNLHMVKVGYNQKWHIHGYSHLSRWRQGHDTGQTKTQVRSSRSQLTEESDNYSDPAFIVIEYIGGMIRSDSESKQAGGIWKDMSIITEKRTKTRIRNEHTRAAYD